MLTSYNNVEMIKMTEKKVLRLKCKRCGRVWDYKGAYQNFPFAYVTCPVCRTSVKIDRDFVSVEVENK
jgi:endogenous inhibitor of DNA gyrase (YacG/DUF329 family)